MVCQFYLYRKSVFSLIDLNKSLDISIKIEYMHLLNPAISLPNMFKKIKSKVVMVNATLGRYLISFSCIPTMVKMLNLCIFYHTHKKKKKKKWRKEHKGNIHKMQCWIFLETWLEQINCKRPFLR